VDVQARRGNAALFNLITGRLPELQRPGVWYEINRSGEMTGPDFEAADRIKFTANSNYVVRC
jgi:hypothetical protein